jgi:hemoglobin
MSRYLLIQTEAALWLTPGMEHQIAADADTPFARLGGAAGVRDVVDELYRRAAADPELAGYFHTTDMESQRNRLADMIGAAMGGPPAPWLKGLDEAHRGRGISHRHFSLMASHLIDALEQKGIESDEADQLTAWFAQGRDAVVDRD